MEGGVGILFNGNIRRKKCEGAFSSPHEAQHSAVRDAEFVFFFPSPLLFI